MAIAERPIEQQHQHQTPRELVRPISPKDAREFVRVYHPNGKCSQGLGTLNFGLFLGKQLVGVCTWGHNISQGETAKLMFGNHSTGKDYLDNLRLVVNKSSGAITQPSALVSFCAKILFKFRPELRYLVAYSSGIYGYLGKIYQASNFVYTGKMKTNYFYIPNYGLVTSRSIANYLPSRRLEYMQKIHPGAKVLNSYNYRYIRFRDDKTKRYFLDSRVRCFKLPESLPTDAENETIDSDGQHYPSGYFKHMSSLPYFDIHK